MVIGSINSIICTNDCHENKSKEVRRKFQLASEINISCHKKIARVKVPIEEI